MASWGWEKVPKRRQLEKGLHLQGKSFVFVCLFVCLFFKFIYLFLTEREWGRGREREAERENPKQALHGQHGACSSNSTNHEIMTWAETKSWMLNQMRHPGLSPQPRLPARQEFRPCCRRCGYSLPDERKMYWITQEVLVHSCQKNKEVPSGIQAKQD